MGPMWLPSPSLLISTGSTPAFSPGDPTVPLSEIYSRAPEIFRDPESAHSEVPVRLPYLKVTRMLAQRRSQVAAESPAENVVAAPNAGALAPDGVVVSPSGLAAQEPVESPVVPASELVSPEAVSAAVVQNPGADSDSVLHAGSP
jgi:hypothetical protein